MELEPCSVELFRGYWQGRAALSPAEPKPE